MNRETTFPVLIPPNPDDLSGASFRHWIAYPRWLSHFTRRKMHLVWPSGWVAFDCSTPSRAGRLIIALLIFVAICCLGAYARYTPTRGGVYVFVWTQHIIFLHGVAHLITSIWFLAYTPGLVTGVLLPAVLVLWVSKCP